MARSAQNKIIPHVTLLPCLHKRLSTHVTVRDFRDIDVSVSIIFELPTLQSTPLATSIIQLLEEDQSIPRRSYWILVLRPYDSSRKTSRDRRDIDTSFRIMFAMPMLRPTPSELCEPSFCLGRSDSPAEMLLSTGAVTMSLVSKRFKKPYETAIHLSEECSHCRRRN
jgi:hypothetical protein